MCAFGGYRSCGQQRFEGDLAGRARRQCFFLDACEARGKWVRAEPVAARISARDCPPHVSSSRASLRCAPTSPRRACRRPRAARRARRRRHAGARSISEAQRKLQHIPRLLRAAPFRKLVAPGGCELRPAQRFGFVGREQFRDRAVRPCEPPLRWFEQWPLVHGMNREQARLPFDHHVADVDECFSYECDSYWLRLATPLRGAGRKARHCWTR